MSEFDIASAGFDSVMYVRLQAQSQFMLDAVEAVQIIPGIEESDQVQVTDVNMYIWPTVFSPTSSLNILNPGTRPIHAAVYNSLGQEIETPFVLRHGDLALFSFFPIHLVYFSHLFDEVKTGETALPCGTGTVGIPRGLEGIPHFL